MRVTAFRGTDRTTTSTRDPGADSARPGGRLTRRRVGTWLAVGACVLAALAWVGGMPTSEYTVEIGLRPLPANASHGDVQQPSPHAIAVKLSPRKENRSRNEEARARHQKAGQGLDRVANSEVGGTPNYVDSREGKNDPGPRCTRT